MALTPDTTLNMALLPPTAHATATGEEITEDLSTDHSVQAQLANLHSGVTYHFRLVAENPYGTAASEDQTFGFHPPSCPNAHLRQQTNSSSSSGLPSLRARLSR